jgi:hypothetical protein
MHINIYENVSVPEFRGTLVRFRKNLVQPQHGETEQCCLVPLFVSRELFHLSDVARDRISLGPISSRMKANVSDPRLIANWFLL